MTSSECVIVIEVKVKSNDSDLSVCNIKKCPDPFRRYWFSTSWQSQLRLFALCYLKRRRNSTLMRTVHTLQQVAFEIWFQYVKSIIRRTIYKEWHDVVTHRFACKSSNDDCDADRYYHFVSLDRRSRSLDFSRCITAYDILESNVVVFMTVCFSINDSSTNIIIHFFHEGITYLCTL